MGEGLDEERFFFPSIDFVIDSSSSSSSSSSTYEG